MREGRENPPVARPEATVMNPDADFNRIRANGSSGYLWFKVIGKETAKNVRLIFKNNSISDVVILYAVKQWYEIHKCPGLNYFIKIKPNEEIVLNFGDLESNTVIAGPFAIYALIKSVEDISAFPEDESINLLVKVVSDNYPENSINITTDKVKKGKIIFDKIEFPDYFLVNEAKDFSIRGKCTQCFCKNPIFAMMVISAPEDGKMYWRVKGEWKEVPRNEWLITKIYEGIVAPGDYRSYGEFVKFSKKGVYTIRLGIGFEDYPYPWELAHVEEFREISKFIEQYLKEIEKEVTNVKKIEASEKTLFTKTHRLKISEKKETTKIIIPA